MSLTKRDIELIQLGFKCFENPPKVNFEKLASIAGLKNASSAQTCYNGAKRKFLNGAVAATSAASLATGSTTSNSSPSAPASKKRKTSAKTTTSKPTKGKGGKASTATAKGPSVADHDDDAFDADDDAEDDDEEAGEGPDAKDLLAFISEETAASAAALQLKFDQDAHTVKDPAPTPDNGDHDTAAKTNAGEDDIKAKAKEIELPTVVKAEAQDEEEVKAKELLREAVQKVMNASRGNAILGADKDVDLISAGNMVDLSEERADEKVVETSMGASVKTVSEVEGGKKLGTVDGA